MHANVLFPILLLLAAGCARTGDAQPPAPASARPDAAPRAEVSDPAPPAAANARAAAVESSDAGPSAPSWHAFGNEPFWSVEARGGTLVFKTPEDPAGVTLEGKRVPSLVGTVILGTGPRGEFHLGITPGECSDGMSDRTHAHASTFIYAGTTYKGCAEPR